MNKTRLEAFSDGVIAIAITIMVLELKTPHTPELGDLLKLLPQFLAYVLSFIYVGIYWVNHHHLIHAASRVNGRILWANLHLLFWLSLVPFVTGWMAENHAASIPVAGYGVVLLMCSIAFWLLSCALRSSEGRQSNLSRALGKGLKIHASTCLYAIAIPLSFWNPTAGMTIYVAVALLWFLPDRRLETVTAKD